ncbi:MAG: polyhydroxyalkanoate synthesis repressor PhaR [Rhodospirillales bacterium]|jgi:polyhydroxyalkanoate synthesis repressor PhaR|nr:polyhydroxyalkanoate synthesis repressor PhaR [Rhodospirillales bacterium]
MSQSKKVEIAQEAEASAQPVVVKKYANRRLYNTESSSYVTLEDLAAMIRAGRDFVVYDAKSGDDITRSVLTQIIVEEEAKGKNLLPESFLRQMIGFYGNNMGQLVPGYLEFAMSGFAKQQEQWRSSMQQAIGGFKPFDMPFDLTELGQRNVAMMERAMSLFTPFQGRPVNEVDTLRAENDALKAEIAKLRTK